ncbi:hypothetical protein SCHPADRAFT_939865 [Schizopora paradoxa]|uniref:Uncharacterized protein n=1 Tax=Schizopora paradoxa TaxID=27342 RepID=A0A0H2RQ42_9AGAM|nr:hypothetical protein SCHPADRAFT_939865 [Schizopora paradoxa]
MAILKSRGKLEQKVEDDARHEHYANERLIWLVIINEADDAKIKGKEAMDNSDDTVAIDDQQLEESRELCLVELGVEESDLQPEASGSGRK